MSDYIKMNRREWFKQAFTKTKEASLKTTSHAMGSFVEVSDTLKEYRWVRVTAERDLGTSPKQVMVKGKTIYLVRQDDKIKALEAICPSDNILVFWQGHMKQFYCPICEKRYHTDGICKEDETIKLNELPTRVDQEVIQVRLD